jgi:adenosylhomocysteine nucleosidase
MKTILILSALEKTERQIILNHLESPKVEKHLVTGTDYYVSVKIINGRSFRILLGRTDQTNYNAGIETERAINYFKPEYVFFVGVAGGLKDVKVGDIVIGQDVYGYERGKAAVANTNNVKTSVYRARPKFGASSYSMERLATNFAFSKEWQKLASDIIDKQYHDKVSVLTGTIASGEKVDADVKSDLHAFLMQNCGHALAVEMEGLGFLEACRPYPQIHSLLIRGISDLVNDKEGSDAKGSQEYATKNAASFLFALIEQLGTDSNESSFTKEALLLDVLCKLYPEGVKDNNVYKRAGGDLSRIKLNSNGFVQWHDTLDLISNGGSISIQDLIKELKNDFPKNEFILKL